MRTCSVRSVPVLIGREPELAAVEALLSGLASSGGWVVLIRGEAGVGKSALIRELGVRHVGEALVLTGWCDDLTTPQPLGPFWDIARERTSLMDALAAGHRPGMWDDLMGLLSHPSVPTILVIEDTQWADEATLDTIKYLGRRMARVNGLLVLTYRDGEVDVDHALRGVIGELPTEHLVRLHLGCLPPAAVAAMVGATDLDLDEVVELTGGNPLFVAEVVASGTQDVPATIQDAVLARAAKLSPGARRLVDLVSVIPGVADRALVEAAIGPTTADVGECVRQGLLLVEDGSVMFHHELTRRAIESSLTDGARRELNRQVLATMTGDQWSQRVHHAVEAGDVAAILTAAPRAARAAMAASSHREAVAHFRALEPHLELVPLHERAGIVEDWARSEWAVVSSGAVGILDRAIELRRADGARAPLMRALTFAVQVYERSGRPDDADACASEAVTSLRLLPPNLGLASALLEQAWLVLMRGDDDPHGVRVADEAIAIARAVGDDRIVTRALILKGAIGTDATGCSQTSLVEEALQRAQAGGQHDEEAYALYVLAGAAADHRDIRRAADLVRRARETAARHEIRDREIAALAVHAEILVWQGRWDEAEDAAVEALGSHVHAEILALRVLGTVAARRGRAGASEVLARMWSAAAAFGELQHLDPAASALAEHQWLTAGSDPELVVALHDVVARGIRSASPWPSGALTFWMWELGLLTTVPEGTPDFYRWIIEGHWREAAQLWEARGAPYDRALALMHGDAGARLLALEIFETLEAHAAAARLRQDLRGAGVRVPRGRARSTRKNEAGLTARQAEVLELLAAGLSNATIADRLFISPRTAENHVSAILMKLGATSREAAVVAAQKRNLATQG